MKIFSQENILDRLKSNSALRLDYFMANSITRAKYADYIWADKSIEFRCHFMFHTEKIFNGFSDGKKMTNKKHGYLDHCCYCCPADGGYFRNDCRNVFERENIKIN